MLTEPDVQITVADIDNVMVSDSDTNAGKFHIIISDLLVPHNANILNGGSMLPIQ